MFSCTSSPLIGQHMETRKKASLITKLCFAAALSLLVALLAIGGIIISKDAQIRAITPSGRPLDTTAPAEDILNEEGANKDIYPDVDWEYWQGINPDVVAWLTVPGTGINTPIVQASSSEPEYYLTHDVYRDWNINGCPYLDAVTEADGVKSRELLIYGHNTGFGGLQFHDLQFFSDYAYASEHVVILFQTPTEQTCFMVSAVDVVDASRTLKPPASVNAAALEQYYQEQYMDADVKLVKVEEFSRLLTMVTCSYNFNPDNERTIVYGVDNKVS